MRLFDHVDLRVSDLVKAGPFYRSLLPSLGFKVQAEIEGWLQFEAAGDGPAEFLGVTEDSEHKPNANRVAFWAESKARVDELSAQIARLGAMNIEGPDFES